MPAFSNVNLTIKELAKSFFTTLVTSSSVHARDPLPFDGPGISFLVVSLYPLILIY